MRAEFATVFRAAIARGELPADADPDRQARRFQAKVTALRQDLHEGTRRADIETLAEDMARELETLRLI